MANVRSLKVGWLTALLLLVSVSGSLQAGDLLGVARATGAAWINGEPFQGQVNVFSGDRLRTGRESTLTFSTSPQERVLIAADSNARLTREEGKLSVSLERGTMGFKTAGQTRVSLADYGVTVRGREGFPVAAEIAYHKGVKAEVTVLRGQVELSGYRQSLILKKGDLGRIAHYAAANPPPSPAAPQESGPGSVRAVVVDQRSDPLSGVAVTLINIGDPSVTHEVITDNEGNFRVQDLDVGRYNIRMFKRGYASHELPGIEVLPSRETWLGHIMMADARRRAGGAATARTPVMMIALAGGAAGAAAGAAVALILDDDVTTISPTKPSRNSLTEP